MARDKVLVTGASGFIAKHVVLELLRQGFDVRGSVRSEERAEDVRQIVRANGEDAQRCDFALVDFDSREGWVEGAIGCRYVLHTASPFPLVQPRRGDALVETARKGTDVVLRAAASARVERAIVTSSIAAVVYGHPHGRIDPFGEGDFTDLRNPAVSPYARSKTVAELHAWDVSRETGLPISTVNPGLVFGPVLDRRLGTSAQLVAYMMKGWLPFLPDVFIPAVDVRDVAAGHVRAMVAPEAGRRFILVAPDTPSLPQVAEYLAESFPDRRGRLPRWRLPRFALRVGALVSPGIAMLAEDVGRAKPLDAGPARDSLGMTFTPVREAATAMAESLLRHGCV